LRIDLSIGIVRALITGRDGPQSGSSRDLAPAKKQYQSIIF
jgi:hypothetical protein